MQGRNTEERMHEVTHLMAERDVPFSVERRFSADQNNALPILTAEACPYPDLANRIAAFVASRRCCFRSYSAKTSGSASAASMARAAAGLKRIRRFNLKGYPVIVASLR